MRNMNGGDEADLICPPILYLLYAKEAKELNREPRQDWGKSMRIELRRKKLNVMSWEKTIVSGKRKET